MSISGRPGGAAAGPVIGVSGGGGEPLDALVVEVDAVELMRFIAEGSRLLPLPPADGGGKYGWLVSADGARCVGAVCGILA